MCVRHQRTRLATCFHYLHSDIGYELIFMRAAPHGQNSLGCPWNGADAFTLSPTAATAFLSRFGFVTVSLNSYRSRHLITAIWTKRPAFKISSNLMSPKCGGSFKHPTNASHTDNNQKVLLYYICLSCTENYRLVMKGHNASLIAVDVYNLRISNSSGHIIQSITGLQ